MVRPLALGSMAASTALTVLRLTPTARAIARLDIRSAASVTI